MPSTSSTDAAELAKSIIKIIFIVLLVVIILFGSFYIVGAGERAVLVTLGRADDISREPGLHFKFPIIQKAVKFDVKIQKYETDASAASSDLQTVNAKMAVNYHVSPESVPSIYKEIGVDYSDRIIQPLVQENIKAATARFSAEELITKREIVREEMRMALTERLRSRGIIIEEVSIVDFDFSPSFNEAIEAKVTAEQNALAAKNKLEQIKYEAEQQIVAARGQSEAQALLARSVTSETLEYQSLLNQRTAIEKWNGNMPIVMGGSSMPFIDMSAILGGTSNNSGQ